MALEPRNLDELQKALNDASGKASTLWITFITFQLYLVIAFGSVTHRDLFLENPIKLPLLNVDLSLTGFFAVAPTLLVIFHFYVFLQFLALAKKARVYEALLRESVTEAFDCQYLRQRLDPFLVLQVIVGPSEQRTGFSGLSLRLIKWITLVGVPVLTLLQAQVTFLPYHKEGLIWLQRIVVFTDLTVIWYFWVRMRNSDAPILASVPPKTWPVLAGAASFCVVIFSVSLATFPGEWTNDNLPSLRVVPFFSADPDRLRDARSRFVRWVSLHEILFGGEVDAVRGRARSFFSNRIIVTDQSFIDDPDKLDKVKTTKSFRGRDLRQAELNRADLRKADFTGAMLNDARLDGANLQNAQFKCATNKRLFEFGEGVREWPDDGCTWLQRASLEGAQLQGASLDLAHLQGAWLDFAELQGASLDFAELQGAWLTGSQLQGASLSGAHLQGASLDFAKLQGASLDSAQLQGASLDRAQLQGASLDRAQLQGASLVKALVWRATGSPDADYFDILNLDGIDPATKPWERDLTFVDWRDRILGRIPEGIGPIPQAITRNAASTRLSLLDSSKPEPENVTDARFWNDAAAKQVLGEEGKKRVADYLSQLACSEDSAPYVASRLLYRIRHTDSPLTDSVEVALAARLQQGKSNPSACPGVKGFTDGNWARVDEIVQSAPNAAPAAQAAPR